ncbi:unnamed protein product [Medioppia subpectinata]|uniref:Uncharacterized protein n=1 Tax=Medioppia subpectinata TaxID=1979941 RepID=A0A7R9L4R8_9ACAR|nr:unnamed protein product [Medioppia subpectinata]CAG2115541.1 unnamed protein product [Medioppia subpectinata]
MKSKDWEALRVYCPTQEMDIMNPFLYHYNPNLPWRNPLCREHFCRSLWRSCTYTFCTKRIRVEAAFNLRVFTYNVHTASHLMQTSYQRTVEGLTRRCRYFPVYSLECNSVEHEVGPVLPVSIAAEAVLALGITGNTEASQTLRLLAPLTLNWGSTTTSGLSIAPIRQVPDG